MRVLLSRPEWRACRCRLHNAHCRPASRNASSAANLYPEWLTAVACVGCQRRRGNPARDMSKQSTTRSTITTVTWEIVPHSWRNPYIAWTNLWRIILVHTTWTPLLKAPSKQIGTSIPTHLFAHSVHELFTVGMSSMIVFSITAKSSPRHPKLHHLETVMVVGSSVAIEITRTKATSTAARITEVLCLKKDTGTLAMLVGRPTHGRPAMVAINMNDLINRAAAITIAAGLNWICATCKTKQNHKSRGAIAILASTLSILALIVAITRHLRGCVMPVLMCSAR